jgi:hypothetical protein
MPSLTLDLILSAKKPFVVVSGVAQNAAKIERRLGLIFGAKFKSLKKEGKIPERTEFLFQADASIEIKADGEFEFTGIFDGKRWFIVTAKLAVCPEASDGFREVLQRASPEDVIQTAFRVCARAKIRQWGQEASALEEGFIYSVERHPFKISLCQGSPFPCFITATLGDDGDFVLTTEPACPDVRREDGFQIVLEKVIRVIRAKVMKNVTAELVNARFEVFTVGDGELLAIKNGVLSQVGIGPRGQPIVKCPSMLGSEVKKTTIGSVAQLLLDLSINL